MSDYTERKRSLFKLYNAALRARHYREAYDYLAQIEQHVRDYETNRTDAGAIVSARSVNLGGS